MKNKYVYIIAALATALLLISIEIRHQEDLQQIATLTAENEALGQHALNQADEIRWQKVYSSALQSEVAQLTKENTQLRQAKPDEAQKTNRGGERLTSLGTYTVTAYCSCDKCCGKYAKDRPGGKVYGAAGVELTPGVSVAGWLPFGTHIMIDGHEYTVQDRTAKWVRDKYNSRIIDMYFEDHQAAWNWGKQRLEVWEVAR